MSEEIDIFGSRQSSRALAVIEPEKVDREESRARAQAHTAGPRRLRLVDLIEQEDCDAALRALRGALSATSRMWNMATQEVMIFEDHKTRTSAALAFFAYVEGTPIARSIALSATFKDSRQELLELARTVSGRRELLRAGLIDAQWLKTNGIE